LAVAPREWHYIRVDRELQAVRDRLAKYIIEQARHGERDQRRLRDGALLQYAQSNLKSKPRK
jgi:uncharacterized protein YdaU (DUF1376 family)